MAQVPEVGRKIVGYPLIRQSAHGDRSFNGQFPSWHLFALPSISNHLC